MNDSNGSATPAQRAMFAADAVARHELGMAQAAEFYGVGKTSVEKALKIKERSIDVASEVRTGKLTLNAGARRVGYVLKRRVRMDHGDKWPEIIPPALTYAQYWAEREYTRLNPKEAKRRLGELRGLLKALKPIERELETRSAPATLTSGRR